MFSIIISEKGGAERRESFDKNEINVGRVQGNDLMLPKGNVSKHHARLLYRDGRFIVTDLKSTNGTYVNGRKIAQATIVREGDKIYIGDFVLRLDTMAGAGAAVDQPTPMADQQGDDIRTMGRTGPNAGNAVGTGPSGIGPAPMGGSGIAARPAGMPPLPVETGAPNPYGGMEPHQGAPHHEHEPEPGPLAAQMAQPMAIPKAPAAPRIPAAMPGPGAAGAGPALQTPFGGGSRGGTAALPQTQSSAPTRAGVSSSGAGLVSAPVPSPQQVPPPRPSGPGASSGAPSRVPPRETPQQAQRRQALATLIERVADATDFAPVRAVAPLDDVVIQRLERNIRENAHGMHGEGELPDGVDLETLVRDAVREVTGLGPIGPLLDDDEVTEIHVMRHEYVLAVRGGAVTAADAPLTSDLALRRIIHRLAQQAGEPIREGEQVVERRLPRGAHMIALLPPTAATHALVIRKRRRLDMSLEDFVRLGGLSRAMATFLENCIAARANIFLCGSHPQAVASFLAALAQATPPGDRVAVVQEVDEIAVQHAHVVSIALADNRTRGEEAIRAASKLRADRLIVASLGGNLAAATVEAISEGAEGVLAASAAPTLRQGVSRLVAQVLLGRAGMSVEAARECVGESFDVALEVAPLADGRHRVIRMAELGGADAKGVVIRDLFTSAPEGPEGAFAATGVVPRVVGEFSQRGVKVDPNLFKRSVGRG